MTAIPSYGGSADVDTASGHKRESFSNLTHFFFISAKLTRSIETFLYLRWHSFEAVVCQSVILVLKKSLVVFNTYRVSNQLKDIN